ncbi:MAG TPA: glycosyltransferase [Acidobacteriaceae bacterium]|jgi:glycosyltransferase involved in cell wall biosynthesis
MSSMTREHNAIDRPLRPLVSVIVVVFRDRVELEAVVDSILPFRGPDLELLVIDGGSEDGSVELLGNMGDQVDYWLSERDAGVYDAMNKGIRAARGTYVLHVNAGDRLLAIPWEQLRSASLAGVDVVSGRVHMDSSATFLPRTGFLSRIDNTWHHQGTFYLRKTHTGYDPSYRICGDFNWNQRLLKAGCSVEHSSILIAEHRNDGLSMQKNARREIYRSIRETFGPLYLLPAAARFMMAPLWRFAKVFRQGGRVRH